MVVGWVACPWELHDKNNTACESTSEWRTSMPMQFGTRMSLHTLPTTTSYDRDTQAIVDIQPLAPKPTKILTSASDYKKLMELIFLPHPNATFDRSSQRQRAHLLDFMDASAVPEHSPK